MTPLLVKTLLACSVFAIFSSRTLVAASVNLTVGGIFVPVFTTVDYEGNLNLDVIPEFADYLVERGMDGVLLSGSAGEGPKLTVCEKKQLYEAWRNECRLRGLGVIAQVGGIPVPDAQELARYAQELELDAVMTLPELYYKPVTTEQAVYFLKCIADAAPNIPLLYYDIPAMTDVYLNITAFFAQATEQIPNFKGVKTEDFDDALELQTKVRGDQRIFVADVLYLGPAVLMGFENFIMTEMNIFPELVRAIVDTGRQGDQEATRYLYEQLEDYTNSITAIANETQLAALKEAATLVTGIPMGPIRIPDLPLSEYEKEEIKVVLSQKGIELRGAK